MKVAVQHLKPGDVLSGSGEEVISITLASINLPSGYASVTLERTNRACSQRVGEKSRRTSQWRKNTIVNIRDDV
jgi:hypothetical protein